MDCIEIISIIISLGALIVSVEALNQSRKANKTVQEINYNEYYRLIANIIEKLRLVKVVTSERDLNEESNFSFVQEVLVELDEKINKVRDNLDLPKNNLYFLDNLTNDMLRLFGYLNYETFEHFSEEISKLIKKLEVKIEE